MNSGIGTGLATISIFSPQSPGGNAPTGGVGEFLVTHDALEFITDTGDLLITNVEVANIVDSDSAMFLTDSGEFLVEYNPDGDATDAQSPYGLIFSEEENSQYLLIL